MPCGADLSPKEALSAKAPEDGLVKLSSQASPAALLLVSLLLVACQPGGPSPGIHRPAALQCSGVNLKPSDDIQGAIDGHPDNTTFCLAPGEYPISSNIEPKSGDGFIGAGMDATFLMGDGAEIIIDANAADASDVAVARMDISGAEGDSSCKPECGTGFSGGVNNLVESVRLHDNPNHGIGGSESGLVVLDSILDHNGSDQFVGCCSGGIKGGTGFTIIESQVYSNIGVGIWCDVGCDGGMKVYQNTVRDNTRDGIRYEISSDGAVIGRNRVTDNNTSDVTGGHGGITSVGSANATITGNELGGNGVAGVVITAARRRPKVADIDVGGNALNGDRVVGCSLSGVQCNQTDAKEDVRRS